MLFYRTKSIWITATLLSPLLIAVSIYGIKTMKSTYKTDLGNGIVIFADDYVKTGEWVFDCNYSRLISRKPLPIPILELENAGRLNIGSSLLNKVDEQLAKEALSAITSNRDWYKNLRYLYSALDESSKLNSHSFYLIAEHANRPWAVEVNQSIYNDGQSHFTVTIEPYTPETYVDYAKALKTASGSCPTPQ